MSLVTIKQLQSDFVSMSGTPYGNALRIAAGFATTAAGAVIGSDKAGAAVVGDVVRFGVIPAGTRLEDALLIVSDAFTATQTIKLGFAYCDGVDVAAVPQDDDYFGAALAISAVGRTRANNTASRPVVLPKDAFLIATIGVADTAAAGVLDVVIEGTVIGMP